LMMMMLCMYSYSFSALLLLLLSPYFLLCPFHSSLVIFR
jgi:hypothetical protein